jgi:membrane protein required for beta-lactamase induction
MNSTIQSMGYGLLSILFVTAVVLVCTVGKAALKKYLHNAARKAHSREKE